MPNQDEIKKPAAAKKSAAAKRPQQALYRPGQGRLRIHRPPPVPVGAPPHVAAPAALPPAPQVAGLNITDVYAGLGGKWRTGSSAGSRFFDDQENPNPLMDEHLHLGVTTASANNVPRGGNVLLAIDFLAYHSQRMIVGGARTPSAAAHLLSLPAHLEPEAVRIMLHFP
ncbi:hypothetical protein LJR289_001546 [Pseudoduganella sp. LjRoot289]|uniref:hypothetical protein n=1 Tax=Pseudoduganella sp. LjRoot289 TaxID=3342314 RepID=UPI003ECDE69B